MVEDEEQDESVDQTVQGGPSGTAPSTVQPPAGDGPGDPEWERRQRVLMGETEEGDKD